MLPLQIAITLFILVLGMVIKMAEASLFSVSESELDELLASGKKSAVRVSNMRKATSKVRPALRSALTITEFQLTAFLVLFFSKYISEPVINAGGTELVAIVVGALVTVVVAAFLTVFFIAVLSRHIAIKHSLKASVSLSLFTTVIVVIYTPFSSLIEVLSNAFLRPLGINAEKQENGVSEETIRMMVDAGNEQGTIETEEKEFIENVFAFNDLSADEVATHRTSITILWTNETQNEWEKTISKSHHTYFPICDDKIDNVVGVLNAKEYFRIKERTKENVMAHAVKPPYFIPESMKANAILKSMKQKRTYFAVVVDEYGGMSGIVTVTDLLQCIVGDIFDDLDMPHIPEIEPLDSKMWMIRGSAEKEDVEKALGIDLDGDFETFAGYVLTMVDFIPDDGEIITVENEIMTVKITSVKDRRIEKTMVQLKEKQVDEN